MPIRIHLRPYLRLHLHLHLHLRLHLVFLALAAAGFAVCAPAADAPRVAVHERVLVLPKLPTGSDTPMNLPEEGAVKLPYVTGGAPGVAKRINETVWREMLDGAAAPATPGKTFTPPPDQLPQGTTSLQYTAELIPAANPRLLSLGFSGEGCGAYCEEFTGYRIFDLRDGRALSLGDLLSVEGFVAVARRVDAERRRAYQKQVRELRAALKSVPGARKQADDDDADRLAFNQDCLKRVSAEPSTPQWLLGDVFALGHRGSLVLTRGRCSNHAMRALDDVGEITVAMSAVDLKPWLTPYGLAVVLRDGDAPPPPASFDRRELHGRLGGKPVTMQLEPLREGVDTRGWYAYDRYRTPIALTVRKQGEAVQAVEQAESQGRFDLTISGGSLAGTWSGKDDRAQLPVIFQ